MENPKEGVFRPLRCLRSRSSSCFVSGGFFPYSWRRLYYTHRKGSGSRSLDCLITHQRGTLWHHNEQPAETTKEECRNSQIHSERLELSTAQTTITVNEMVSPLSIHILEHLAKETPVEGNMAVVVAISRILAGKHPGHTFTFSDLKWFVKAAFTVRYLPLVGQLWNPSHRRRRPYYGSFMLVTRGFNARLEWLTSCGWETWLCVFL